MCRNALANGEMDKVCPECLKGIEEGRGVFDIADRTQLPALGLLSALILIPIGWYLWKKPYSKKGKGNNGETMGGEM